MKKLTNILLTAIATVTLTIVSVSSVFAAETIQKKTSFGTATAVVENYVGTLKGLNLTIDGKKVNEIIVARASGSAQMKVSITGNDTALYSNAYPAVFTCKDGKTFVKGEQGAIGAGNSDATSVNYAVDGLVGTTVNYYTDESVSKPATIKGSPVVADFGYMLIVSPAAEKSLAEKGYLSEFNKYEYPGLAEMLGANAASASKEPSKDDIIANFMKSRIIGK